MNNGRRTKRILATLLAALVAFCPVKCMMAGCYSCQSAGLVSSSTTCGCCTDSYADRPVSQGDDQSIPEEPGNCSCDNCFCQGALSVITATMDLPEFESELAFEVVSWIVEDEVLPRFSQIAESSYLPYRCAGGVEMRAALSCWIL